MKVIDFCIVPNYQNEVRQLISQVSGKRRGKCTFLWRWQILNYDKSIKYDSIFTQTASSKIHLIRIPHTIHYFVQKIQRPKTSCIRRKKLYEYSRCCFRIFDRYAISQKLSNVSLVIALIPIMWPKLIWNGLLMAVGIFRKCRHAQFSLTQRVLNQNILRVGTNHVISANVLILDYPPESKHVLMVSANKLNSLFDQPFLLAMLHTLTALVLGQ